MRNRFIYLNRRLPKWQKIVGIIVISFIALAVLVNGLYALWGWAGVRFFPVEARTQHLSHRSLAQISRMRTVLLTATEYNLEYFHSVEEAMDAHFFREIARERPPNQNRGEIKRFAEVQEMLVIFAMDNDSQYAHIVFRLHLIDGDMISYPLYFWPQNIAGCSVYRRRVYQDDDRIARDIIWAYTAQHVTSRVNGGEPIFYGVGIGAPPVYMSILGYQPDVIMPFTHSGNEYFFWYYRNAPLFTEVYERYIHVDTAEIPARARNLRLGDVIDIFEIQIIR